MRYLWLLSVIFFFGCSKQEVKKQSTDFEELMGKNLPAWSYVKTKEDRENLQFFKSLYDKNFPLMASPSENVHIPKVLHVIWIGPKPFPPESVKNIHSWMTHNPHWKVKFWTDRKRTLPHENMQECRVQDFHFLQLARCYKYSENYGEKSDLLRYEILYQEGGVYIDHDVECMQSFDLFNNTYDFYVGMQMPDTTFLSSSVVPTNNLIGARAGHPIMKRCLDVIEKNWDRIEQEYPGNDRNSMISRVAHRTFIVLGDSYTASRGQGANRDIVFPAFYFNAPKGTPAIFSRHQFKGTWFESETLFEQSVRKRLVRITKKTNKQLLSLWDDDSH
ncbi:MAG: hypothetical protein LVR00_07930 [Rhabdochlamydiaceae bacterium]